MKPRLLAVGIVLFWGVMTTLLVRQTVAPSRSAFFELPVAYVTGLIFRGGQESHLVIEQDGQPVGYWHFTPRITPAGLPELAHEGSLAVRLPFTASWRVTWEGHAHFDPALQLTGGDLTLNVKEQEAHLELHWTGSDVQYTLQQAQAAVATGTLHGAADLPNLLAGLGLDPAMFDPKKTAPGAETATLTARRATLPLRHDRLDTYLLALRQGATLLGEFHISQLGQILYVRTDFGYTMTADELLQH